MERTTWTDHRLDDFAGNVAKRFDHVDQRFDQVDKRFDRLDKRFDQADTRFDRLESQMQAMQTNLVRIGGGLLVGLVGVIATLLAQGA